LFEGAMVESENRISVLYVLENNPESGNSLAFINSYIDTLVDIISEEVSLTLFYPEFSDTEEHYSLNIIPSLKYTKMVSYLPARYESFRETFSNSRMEDIFRYILKDEHFDCVHIWSLKNHSFNYPFIAKERGLPVIVTMCDGFLFSNSVFNKGFSPDGEKEKVRISNFVNSSVAQFVKKLFTSFKNGHGRSSWFENIGRYSKYYNRTNIDSVDHRVFEERNALALETVEFTDLFHFFSQIEYNFFYRNTIPETKVFFLEQNSASDSSYSNRPFEIEGAVKFGFMGEILPEEGILELVEAFNILYDDGYRNELHVYGELHENGAYFSRLKKKVRNPGVIFHGPLQPGRTNPALNTFDVLIIPSKWHRSDSFLINSAICARKALIVSDKNHISEKIRRSNRGLVLAAVNPVEISNAASELERNRKRLYYFMRSTDDYIKTDIEDDLCSLVEIYTANSKKNNELDSVLIKRKLTKRKTDRHWG